MHLQAGLEQGNTGPVPPPKANKTKISTRGRARANGSLDVQSVLDMPTYPIERPPDGQNRAAWFFLHLRLRIHELVRDFGAKQSTGPTEGRRIWDNT